MADESGGRVALQLSGGSVIASVQIDLSESTLETFRADLMECIHSNRARRVVVDLSGVDIMDAGDLDHLRKTLTMASILGALSVVVGIRPGIASALAVLGVDLDGILTARNLDAGIELLQSMSDDKTEEPDADSESATDSDEALVREQEE